MQPKGKGGTRGAPPSPKGTTITHGTPGGTRKKKKHISNRRNEKKRKVPKIHHPLRGKRKRGRKRAKREALLGRLALFGKSDGMGGSQSETPPNPVHVVAGEEQTNLSLPINQKKAVRWFSLPVLKRLGKVGSCRTSLLTDLAEIGRRALPKKNLCCVLGGYGVAGWNGGNVVTVKGKWFFICRGCRGRWRTEWGGNLPP